MTTNDSKASGKIKTIIGLVLVILSVLWMYSKAQGTTVKALSDAELCQKANKIFHGTCESVNTEWDNQGRLVTRYRFKIKENLKSSSTSKIEFVQPGGRLENQALIIPGAANFQPNEEVVVFIGKSCKKTGCTFTVGLSQGKFKIDVDPRSNVKMASRNLKNLELLGNRTHNKRPLLKLLKSIRTNVSRLKAER